MTPVPARIDDRYEFTPNDPGCNNPPLAPRSRVKMLTDRPLKDLDRVLEIKPVFYKIGLAFRLVPLEFHALA